MTSFRIANDLDLLSRYVAGVTTNREGELGDAALNTALMSGVSGSIWAWQNRKDYARGFQNLTNNMSEYRNIIQSYNQVPQNARFSTLRNMWGGAGEATSLNELRNISQKYEGLSRSMGATGSIDDLYHAQVKAYADMGIQSGRYSETLKALELADAKFNLAKLQSKIMSQRASGSVIRQLKDVTGWTKLSVGARELAVKSGTFRSIAKGIKGNAGFAALSFGIGCVCDVIPAFSLGTGKGFKQLGKTAVKTGFEVGGWAAGMAAGTKIGAIAGASIGGPVGAAVGSVIGFVGGMLGSLIASKTADAVVGKSEVELAMEENANAIAEQGKKSDETAEQIVEQAYLTLVEKRASGAKLDAEDIAAKDSIEKCVGQKIDIDAAAEEYKRSMAQAA